MCSGKTGLVKAPELCRALYVPKYGFDFVKAVANSQLFAVTKDEPCHADTGRSATDLRATGCWGSGSPPKSLMFHHTYVDSNFCDISVPALRQSTHHT